MYLNEICEYWNSRAEGYSITIHEQLKTEVGAYFREMLKKNAPKGKGLKCLDIGCGPGFFSIILAQQGHCVTAVDYSEEMLRQACDNFNEAGVNVLSMQGDATCLPFESESFDYIVSRNLVWNLEMPELAYHEWQRLLKPGGRLLVADGNHYLHYYDKTYNLAKASKGDSSHYNHGVDPTPINEIARNLPLSKEHRPQWDLEVLSKAGMEKVFLDVKEENFVDEESGKEIVLVSDFLICFEQPELSNLSNYPSNQDATDIDQSKVSDNYNQIIHDELNSFKAKAWMKKIGENLPDKEILDILDAGCGPAFFSILLSQAGHHVIGVDGARSMLAHAMANAKAYNVSPLFVEGDCHALPFSDASFDLVISRNVTHALIDHQKVYNEWYRVLRHGGKLLIFDANWHLMQTDPNIKKAFRERHQACLRLYGSDFSGDGSEAEENEKRGDHVLKRAIRPAEDEKFLIKAGFSKIITEENITEALWNDKEKLLYGATPMFMISAVKETFKEREVV